MNRSDLDMYLTDFTESVFEFRLWYDQQNMPGSFIRNNRENEYPEWRLISETFENILSSVSISYWNDEIWKNIIFIISRDGDAELLAEKLFEHSDGFLTFVNRVLDCDEPNAKWQAVAQIDYNSMYFDFINQLRILIEDEDEYVARRALGAYAKTKSKDVVSFAEKMWLRDSEYAKLSALYAVYFASSPELSNYIRLAKESQNQLLLKHAVLIEQGDLKYS